uniref:Uncharacterized protein n=1 Tax=Octopus bimaculoides TaxID=37653 RepID=A0A0L8GRD5_OCTBM
MISRFNSDIYEMFGFLKRQIHDVMNISLHPSTSLLSFSVKQQCKQRKLLKCRLKACCVMVETFSTPITRENNGHYNDRDICGKM